MPDIFQAYDYDGKQIGEDGIGYQVFTKHGSFWYYSGGFYEETEAMSAAKTMQEEPGQTGVLVERVTRTLIEKWER